MSQSQLSKKWYHKVLNRLFPGNCRNRLDHALVQNTRACKDMVCYITTNEQKVIAALKSDRRARERV